MAAELPRPGVEVVQVFKTASSTVITPTLPPSIVGVAKQVVEVLTTNASGAQTLNDEALVPLQAVLMARDAVGTPPVYGGLDGKSLVLSFSHGPAVTVDFVGVSLTPSQVVAGIRQALGDSGTTAYTAEKVGNGFRIRSLTGDEFQTIEVLPETDPEVLSAFGIAGGKQYAGASYYSQQALEIATSSFPDPNANLSQLAFEPSTVRAFLHMGGSGISSSIRELLRTESFLQKGSAGAASMVGTADLSALTLPSGIGTGTIALSLNGTPKQVTFSAPANVAAILAQINAVTGADAVASVDAQHHLVLTSTATGPDASIQITGGSAVAALGLTVSNAAGKAGVAAVDLGNGTQVTSILELAGAAFTSPATPAQVTGTVALGTLSLPGALDGKTFMLDDGSGPQTLTFKTPANPAAVLTQVNALFGSGAGGEVLGTLDGSNHLVLTHSRLGQESSITVVGGDAVSVLGLTAGETLGKPFPPQSGDQLYVDGLAFALITQVAPGGNAARVKVNKSVPVSAKTGTSWYIVAKNLDVKASSSGVTRPSPDLEVDDVGNLAVKADVLRDTTGASLTTAHAQLYVSYRALRLDVTPRATNPGLLRFSDTVTLESNLSPISAANPLGLGFYFALLNAPNTLITGIGVDEASDAAPYGTVEGFSRAATFLEAYEVYALAPLTHDDAVSQIFATHVTTMSAPENKGERIVLINPTVPTHKLDTLVASGTSGNTTSTPNQFDTGVANLGALLLAQGKSGVGPYSASEGMYLDVGDGEKYSIANVVGSQVTVRTSGFLPGENDDAYYATSTLPSPLIDAPYAFKIRGAELVLPDGTPDRETAAITVQASSQQFGNRRILSTFPDKCAAVIAGVEQILEGFFMNAAIAGMIAKQPPQQSFTNYPMTGFSRVIGSQDVFSSRQLNVMAAGGNYIIVQDAAGAPLISRMALTTDMTSIETRTDSILKVVDFTAKFLRTGLKNFIGRFNISQGFLDSLGHVLQGLLSFLVESGVLIGGNLNNLIQDTANPDTVLIDILIDVPYPCNYIRLVLTI